MICYSFERHTEDWFFISSIIWFTTQMFATTRAAPGLSQEIGVVVTHVCDCLPSMLAGSWIGTTT